MRTDPADETGTQVLEPVVLVDLGDNIGGGSAGDGTTILEELLRQGAKGFVVPLHDPGAVEAAIQAGVGGRFDMAVGGKADSLHGEPVALRGKVKLLYDGKYVETAARHPPRASSAVAPGACRTGSPPATAHRSARASSPA